MTASIDPEMPDAKEVSGACRYPYSRSASWRVALSIIGIGLLGGGLFFLFERNAELEVALIVFGGFVLAAVLTCFYMLIRSRRAVLVDSKQRMVYLQHMVYPVRFFDVLPKRSVSIPFADIVSVVDHSSKYVRASLVYTKRSRFVISQHFEGYEDLDRRLSSIAAGAPRVSLMRMYSLYAMGGAAVVIAGASIYAAGLMLGWI
jgi:hypothetical protein